MLLKALDTEQFRPDRLFPVSGKSRRRSLQSAKKHEIHISSQSSKTHQERRGV
jgi:hypothetical protein